MTMIWRMLHPAMTPEHLGFIPSFLSDGDPRSTKDQLDQNYSHGGGWRSFKGFTLNRDNMSIKYEGDSPHMPLAMTELRDEKIYFYAHDWVLILQPDGEYDIARLD